MPECAAAILAGGLGSRLGHVDKARLEVGGQPILERLLAVCQGLFSEILVAGRDPERFVGLAVRAVPDLTGKRGSLAGIQAALAHARAPHCFVVACDAPFVSRKLVQLLLSRLEPGDDVLIPRKPDGYLEPLCAIYSRRCLPHIEERLAQDRFKIVEFFPKVRVREIPPEEVLAADPELVSFFNVNTPGDLEEARRLAAPAPPAG